MKKMGLVGVLVLLAIGCAEETLTDEIPIQSMPSIETVNVPQKPVLSKSPRTTEQVIAALEVEIRNRLGDSLHDALVDERKLTLIALKEERTLELWKGEPGESEKLYELPFSAYSGELGPKLRQGDGQIPEGEYEVVYFNPNSSFHLSFKLNYPNARDRAQAASEGRTNLGDDIFIHGEEVTIGCIPLGNRGIETIFYIVANHEVEEVRVLIAPRDFRKGKEAPDVGLDWATGLYEELKEKLNDYRE